MDSNKREEIRNKFLEKYHHNISYAELVNLILDSNIDLYGKRLQERFFFDPMIVTRSYSVGNLTKDHKQIFQFFNKEFNTALSHEISEYKNIVEVGAGSGILTYALKELGLNITATDNYSWELTPYRDQKIIKLTAYQAIRELKPDCVIVSWMPYETDWTIFFKKSKSIKCYILIGEGKGGCTGSDVSFKTEAGWRRKNLTKVEKWGITRTDYDLLMKHTQVFKFTRI